MPTTRFYAKQNKASVQAFVADLARFLINDLGGFTGPGWTIVEAYDADNATNKRRTPTVGDEGNMDNVAFSAGANFGWQLNALGSGDWIVLRSAQAQTGTYFELYIEVDDTAARRVYFKLIPYDDFATAGADVSPPVLPATSVGSGAGLVDFTLPVAGAADYSIVADESLLYLFSDQGGANTRMFIAGEVDGARDNGVPADDRPFVIYDYPPYVSWHSSSYFNRVSPRDDATILTNGLGCVQRYGNTPVHDTAMDGNYLGRWTILPVGVFFYDSGDRHWAGWFRFLGSVSRDQAVSGTMNSMVWQFMRNTGHPGIATEWDGVTAY